MLLTDNPIPGADADEFGFLDHARVLCQAIGDTTSLPLTVGIFGPWGSGKSSFLNICRDLLDRQGFVTLEFNPWKYDKRDEIWHALIQSLLDKLIQNAQEQAGNGMTQRIQKAIDKAWELRAVVAWLLARHALPLVTAGAVGSTDVDAVQNAMNAMKLESQNYRHVNVFEKDFADAVGALTENGRMAVVIDDLDRCRGEQALMALEALRLFTGDASCVFVIAMDHQALIEAAAHHFNNDEARGRIYLEKLINFPYYLPMARFESINRSLKEKLDFLADDSTMWELIHANMHDNPRRIRRFVNTFNLSIATLALSATPSRQRQLQVAVLLMFRQEHPNFFEILQRSARKQDAQLWTNLEQASIGQYAINDLAPDLKRLVESDTTLLDAIASVSPTRYGFDFPPLPTPDQISVLTEAMVLMPLAPPNLAGEPHVRLKEPLT
jgi:predicted KAP-like P-loop ATPase